MTEDEFEMVQSMQNTIELLLEMNKSNTNTIKFLLEASQQHEERITTLNESLIYLLDQRIPSLENVVGKIVKYVEEKG